MGLQEFFLIRFVQWYLFEIPGKWWIAMQNLSPYVTEMFGVKIHLRYLTVPMFHDTTWVGRMLSMAFRMLFVFTGMLVWFLVVIFGGLFMLLWFGMHMMWFIFWPVGLVWWLALVGLFFLRYYSDSPWGTVTGTYSWSKLIDASPLWIAHLLESYPGRLEVWWKHGQISYWLGRVGLGEVPLPGKGEGRKDVLGEAVWQSAQSRKGVHLNPVDLLVGLVQSDQQIKNVFEQYGVEVSDVQALAQWSQREDHWYERYPIWDSRFETKELAGYNRAKTGLQTRILDAFSVDLTANVGSLPESIGRQAEYDQLLSLLTKSNGENVIIVGPTGVGKTTFVSGLAHFIMAGNAPKQIADKRLVKLEPGRLVAGARTQGELAGRMVAVLDDLKASEGIILFVDEMHTLMTTEGGASGMNLFAVLEEALFISNVQFIGTTDQGNYKRYIEPNSGFARMFSVMNLEEPSDASMEEILQNVAGRFERKHQVVVSLQSLRTATRLARRYVHDNALPHTAIDLLDEACVYTKQKNHVVVTDDDVAGVVVQRTGIPVQQMTGEEREKLLHLEEEIHQHFIDQTVAVQTVADALRRARLDVRDSHRPIGSFLFVGPTGVGKTELARRLAEVYFGSEKTMIRFDMTEFSQEQMLNRLVGSPVGTEGYGSGGELTEKVRKQPFSLVLLDEIEKSHPKVWDLLMQVMDEGQLTDAAGLKIDFRNTIIIATSNAVTAFIQDKIEKGVAIEDFKDSLFGELTKTFRVELLNRFDSIVPFGPLAMEQMEQVVRLQLEKLVERVAEKEVKVTYDDALVNLIAVQSVAAKLGARPVRRLIQDKLEAKIAKKMLELGQSKGVEIKLDGSFLE